jgi:hypothetical protein
MLRGESAEGETQGERLRQTLRALFETLWHTRRRRVHTLGQRARSESLVQTRASVPDAAQAKDVAHRQPQGALRLRLPSAAMPPPYAPWAGRRQAEQETAVWSLPRAAGGDGGVTQEGRSG